MTKAHILDLFFPWSLQKVKHDNTSQVFINTKTNVFILCALSLCLTRTNKLEFHPSTEESSSIYFIVSDTSVSRSICLLITLKGAKNLATFPASQKPVSFHFLQTGLLQQKSRNFQMHPTIYRCMFIFNHNFFSTELGNW